MNINRKTWKYKYITSVVLYLKETWKNKLVALSIIALGMLPVIFDKDATFLVIALMLAFPLFIAVEDWFIKTEG